MKAALEENGFKGCKDADLEPVFTYLEFCLKQVCGKFCSVCLPHALVGFSFVCRVLDGP